MDTNTLTRHHLSRKNPRVLLAGAGLFLGALFATVVPTIAAEIVWDADADLSWSNPLNWDGNLEPGAGDDVVLPQPVPNPNALGDPETIALLLGEEASTLTFLDQYTLTGGSLTLTSGLIRVTIGNSSTIESLLTGAGGLLKRGDGAIKLTNALNNYTGTTQIDSGSIIITSQSALGGDASAVVVTGSLTRGVGGGSLVVGSVNNNLDGLTFTRSLELTGGGASGDGSSFNSVGNNIFTGSIVTGNHPAGLNPVGGTPITVSGTRLASTFGTATINGILTVGPSGQSTEFSGNGNWMINSDIDGDGNVIKTGNGLLVLNGNNTFGGVLQLSGGYVRVSSQANLGGSLANNAIFLTNGGKLEIRTDTPDFTTVKRVQLNTGTTTGTIYLDREIGGSGLNQTVTLGLLTLGTSTSTRALVIDGRNGYNLSFTGNMVAAANGSLTVTNNGNGLFTNVGNFWLTTRTVASTLTFNGNGDFLITGGILATGADHILTKSNAGTLTLTGTNSSYSGATNILNGTVAINDFRAVTNNTAVINIGTGSTTATLSVIGHNLTGANVTTSKVINLAGTTGGAIILANQTGTSPGLRFEADFTATGGAVGNAKTLTLGGANAQDNTIAGSIPNNAANGLVNVLKVDAGTWVLAGTNTYTGTTTITNGLLKLAANAASSTVLLSTNAITFGNNNVNAGGTLEFVGQDGVDNIQNLGTLTYASSGGAATIKLTPGLLGTASLVFANMTTGAGGTVNFVGGDFTDNTFTLSLLNGNPIANGIVTRSVYWNGADFAYSEGGVLRAPEYGVNADTATSDTALTAGQNNEITGSFTTPGIAISIDSLKINGGHTLTIGPGGTVTIPIGGLLATGGNSLITGESLLVTGTAALVVRVNGGADLLRIESARGGGSGGLMKSGAGVLVLAGASTQTGTVTIAEGTVRLSGAGVLSADNQTLNIRQNATLDLNGVNTGTAVGQFNNNGTVTNTSADNVTLWIGNGVTVNSTAGTAFGIIEDGIAGGRTSVILSTNNNNAAQNTTYNFNGLSTYTGTTTLTKTALGNLILNTPTLANIGEASSIGAGNATSAATNAASLVFSGAASATQVFATLNYNGNASVSIDRLFTFGGTVADSGARIRANGVNDATLIWSNFGGLAFGTTDIAQGLVLGGASIGSNQFNPLISDNGTGVVSLYKEDAGLWILGNSANSYTGITRIDGGALRAEGTTLPTGSTLVLNGGVFQSSGNFTRSLNAAPAAGAGGVNWAGDGGFAAGTGKLTVNIGGNVTPDTLQWGTGGFVSGSLILSSTTSFDEVEILNSIDLNGATRTIQVNTNTTTNSDFASLVGVISNSTGTAGLTKTGTGILELLADNTYNGDTSINGGTVRAVTIGASTSTASNFGTGAGKITIGTGTTTGTLAYVGDGEISDRLIELAGSTASVVIESSGTGALVLTNLVNASTGTGGKTLFLRGDLNASNEVTSVLTDNGAGGVLSVTKDDNGTWILSGQSTYTGTTTVSSGILGISADSVGGVGAVISSPVGVTRLTISNGTLFALGGDRTLNTLVRLNSNASSNFIGYNSITLNNIETLTGGTMTVTNMLADGELLTLNSPTFSNTETTTARLFQFNGSGDTILNASVTDGNGGSGGVISLTYNGYGSLTLGGTNGASTYSGVTTISSGTLKVGSVDAIPNGAGAANVTMNPGAGLTATLDLNGFDQTINGLIANSLGSANIDNSSATSATFTFGSQDQDVNLSGGITNTGGGGLSLVKTGSGIATMSQGPFSYSGTTSVNGGSLTISSDVSATSGISVGAGAVLGFTGGLSASSGITSVVVGAGGELRLNNTLGQALNNLTTLTLGAGGILGLDLGTTSDTLTLVGPNVASVGGLVSLNIRDTGTMLGGTTYDLLLAAGGGLTTGGSYQLSGIPGGFTSLTLNQSDTVVSLTTGTLISDTRYWTGATDTVWNTVNGTFEGLNWSPDKSGASVSTFVPGSGTTVVFSADNAAGGALVTTLEQGFRINSLEFESSANTAASVAINPGVDSSYRLTIAPSNSAEGINLKAGGPGSVSISAPLRIDADQTWTVADLSSTLTLSGGLSGSGALTIDGPGSVIVTNAATGTFAVPTVLVNNGTLRIEDVGSLGTTIAGNAAAITINSGAVFYQFGPTNTAATGVNNALTLAGGTLSAGGSTSNHYFTGAVNVTADSFINLRDSNSALLSADPTNIILAGAVTGTGRLTVDSNNDLTAGNQLDGVLYLQNDNSGWSGGFNLQRGTIQTQHLNGFGTGNVTVSSGRIMFNVAANNTMNLGQDFTVDSPGGILELSVDAQGTLSGDLVVNLNGVVTLGSLANADNALRLTTSTDNFSILNITNSIVLGNNASISFNGSTVRTMEISADISETGGARSLSINDDLGGWNQTNDTVRLSGTNTFSGDLIHASGTLEYSTVSNIAGPASNLGQGSAIFIGAATLSFVGDTISQSTNRTITQTGASTYGANGANGAVITYAGAIDAGVNNFTLTGTAGSAGFITGGLTQTGTTADGTINGGSWTFSGGITTVADNLTVTGPDTVLSLAGTGVLAFLSGAGSGDLNILNGATVNVSADNPVDMTIPYRLFVGQGGDGDTAILNLGANNIESGRFILGERSSLRNGIVNGTGTLTVVGGDIELYEGTIHANLASTGSLTFDKFGPGIVTLLGDNSGLASTGATIVNDGTLVLDYTVNNATKLREASQLNMIGGDLEIIGNATSATSQQVASFTLGSGGSNYITVTGSGGQDAVLILGNITRANLAQDGTVRFTLPSGPQTATNGITTTSPNSTFGLLGTGATVTSDSAYATVDDGTGTWFATNVGGNIVALVSTVKDDVTTWVPGDHVTNSVSGFTGTVGGSNINSLRFEHAGGSDVILDEGGVLLIGSGGILITDNVTGSPAIVGGTLASGATELVVRQGSAATFEISADLRINHALTKSGSGTLLLTGNNVNTGYLEIQQGSVQISGGNAVGDNSLVVLAANRFTTFELLSDETIGRLSGGRRATDSEYGTVAVGTHTLTINETGNTTYAGLITGSGTIVIQGGFDLTTQNASVDFNGELIINNGAYRMNNISSINATGITLNAGATLMIDQTGTTRSGARILDTTPFTLNSANGVSMNTAFGTITTVRGLWVRSDQDTTLDETVGTITARSGASYVSLESTSASDDSDLIGNDVLRLNNSTMIVRGTNLGIANARNNLFRIGDSTNETTFIGTLVGGGGASGDKNISIVPWAIGENLGSSVLSDLNMGNSFVTYAAGTGFRALDLASEYSTIAAALATDNARESLGADLIGLAGTTVNSLVINNTAFAGLDVTGAGAAQALALTSGAMLFTITGGVNDTTYDTTLGGFDGGITSGGNEYVISVVNPSSAATSATLIATISSNLSSAADITKSGRGTLILTESNAAGGGANKTTLNEGVLEITSLANIGGGTGDLVFAGGTLRLGAGFSEDFSSRNIVLFNAGGVIDTNGNSLVLLGSLGSGLGGITKAGLGNLTLNAAATYSGPTVLSGGTLTIGANNATGAGGDLSIGAGTTLDIGVNSISAGLVSTSGADQVISGTGTISASTGFFFDHDGGSDLLTVEAILAGPGGVFKSNRASNLTLNGANTFAGTLEVQRGTLTFNSITNVGGGASALGAPVTVEDGVIRMGITTVATALTYTGTGHSSDRIIEMQGTTGGLAINGNGTGALELGTIQTVTNGNKTLTLGGSSDGSLDNVIGEIKEVGSVLSVTKTGSNTWELTGSNSYTGLTTVADGILRISSSGALGTIDGGTTVNGDTSIGVLELEGGITVSGETLTLGARQGAALNSSHLRNLSGDNEWNGEINFTTGGSNFNIESAADTLTISGDISGASTTGGRALRLVGAGDGIVSGNVINGSATVSVTKEGTGSWTLSGENTYSGNTAVNEGILQLGDSGTSGSLNTASAVSVASGATFVVNQSDTVTQGTEFSGAAISGDGSFQQAGSGTTILTAANTYTGGTSVTDGILEVNNTSGSGTGTGAVSVTGDAFLTGHGSVQGNTTVSSGATLTAGFDGVSDRTLSFGGDLTMQSGSIWLVDLVNQSTTSDLIAVTGLLSLAGTIDVNQLGGPVFANDGSTYTIATYGSRSGFFSGYNEGDEISIGGGFWTINYGTGLNSAITLTAVPEPGTFGLLGLALAGILFRWFRQRRAAETQ